MKAIEKKQKKVNLIVHFSNHDTLSIPHMFIKKYKVEGLHETGEKEWSAKNVDIIIDKRFLKYPRRMDSIFHEKNLFEPLDRLMKQKDILTISEHFDGMVLGHRSYKVPMKKDEYGGNTHQRIKMDKHDDIKVVINGYAY